MSSVSTLPGTAELGGKGSGDSDRVLPEQCTGARDEACSPSGVAQGQAPGSPPAFGCGAKFGG